MVNNDNNNGRVELLKDIFNHIRYEYELVDRANEGFSDKAMRMAGFCGVIIGLLITIAINREEPLVVLETFLIRSTVTLIFISILCYIATALVRGAKGLIAPGFLLEKFEGNVPSEKFWIQFAKVIKKTYEQTKNTNSIKARWILTGDIFFIFGILSLIGFIF